MTKKTVLLVGAGAVIDSWEPICRAVRRDAFETLPSDSDLARELTSLMFARLVHLMRSLGHAGPEGVDAGLKEGYARLRQYICEEFQRAPLKVRPELAHVVTRLAPADHALVVMTTNWEHAVDAEIERLRPGTVVHHLHGSVRDPSTLYLPTENAIEPYRPPDERRAQAGAPRPLTSELASASRVIVYGLSLCDSDAEVCNLVWGALGPDHQYEQQFDVYIVDPMGPQVARRFAALVNGHWPAGGVFYAHPAQVRSNRFGQVARDFSVTSPVGERASWTDRARAVLRRLWEKRAPKQLD